MIVIPIAGFLLGLLLLCVRQLRFFAPFAILMPATGSWGMTFGFWIAAAGLSTIGASDELAGIAGLLIALGGGLLSLWGGYKLAYRLTGLTKGNR